MYAEKHKWFCKYSMKTILPVDVAVVEFVPVDGVSWCLMSKYLGRSSPAIISFCVKRRSGDVACIDNSAICDRAVMKMAQAIHANLVNQWKYR